MNAIPDNCLNSVIFEGTAFDGLFREDERTPPVYRMSVRSSHSAYTDTVVVVVATDRTARACYEQLSNGSRVRAIGRLAVIHGELVVLAEYVEVKDRVAIKTSEEVEE